MIADEIANLEAVFEGERDDCRRVLEHLLLGRPLRVHADPERRYRIEGALRLRLERKAARPHEGDRAGAPTMRSEAVGIGVSPSCADVG
jgi:hypothetical protein